MKRTEGERFPSISIKQFFAQTTIDNPVAVHGWVKTKRISKKIFFITLSDGSSLVPLQIIGDVNTFAPDLIKNITPGASLVIHGRAVSSPGQQQDKELLAEHIQVLGDAPSNYPLQPKFHTLEFLRSIQHLRMRTKTFQAIFQLRHGLAYALHNFFHKQNFYWFHTPIITQEDTEGAGEVFSVLTKKENHSSEHTFFGKEVFLTVSGQLAAEAGAMGLGKVYTFGPTFRAENSNTKRHLAEFWMVEPEMAFYELQDTITLAENCIKEVVNSVLTDYQEALHILEARAKQAASKAKSLPSDPLCTYLQKLVEKPFIQITYTEAITLLQKTSHLPLITWGQDLQTVHERYLTTHFQRGVIVTDYPKEIKAFYMRQNEDKKTVAAMDILLPGIGEVIGGSQREERFNHLKAAMEKIGIQDKAKWYLDTRLFGTVPHSGFGLGFERLLLCITGMENIRDVIPFPRTPGHITG